MSLDAVSVGVREFRDALAEYLTSPKPLAITRHGETLGYYIPVRKKLDKKKLAALRRTVEKNQALLAELGIAEDEIVEEFQAMRRARR